VSLHLLIIALFGLSLLGSQTAAAGRNITTVEMNCSFDLFSWPSKLHFEPTQRRPISSQRSKSRSRIILRNPVRFGERMFVLSYINRTSNSFGNCNILNIRIRRTALVVARFYSRTYPMTDRRVRRERTRASNTELPKSKKEKKIIESSIPTTDLFCEQKRFSSELGQDL
jgi:hypothetical protein